MFQLPSSWTWQNLRDKFRDIGEVKFAEIRGLDTGVVRFSKEREAEVAISELAVKKAFRDLILNFPIFLFIRTHGW